MTSTEILEPEIAPMPADDDVTEVVDDRRLGAADGSL